MGSLEGCRYPQCDLQMSLGGPFAASRFAAKLSAPDWCQGSGTWVGLLSADRALRVDMGGVLLALRKIEVPRTLADDHKQPSCLLSSVHLIMRRL